MLESSGCKRKRSDYDEQTVQDDIFTVKSLKRLKDNFNKDETNKLVQNALCSNWLYQVSEEREYMQSRDRHFSHTIEPKLVVTNQGLSGRCWMFAVLNVIRYEFIKDMHLPKDFEFSESYLSFYEKIEKCNYFLTHFMDKDEVDPEDYKTLSTLQSGLFEGGYWTSCINLIKKYGLIPKSCYLESINSFNTDVVDDLVSTKLREFSLMLVKEKPENRMELKSKMIEEIYAILSKMLGTPPCPTEEITWAYTPDQELIDMIRIEEEREKTGRYKALEIKKNIKITPLDFYKKFISHNIDSYLTLSHDPRNEFNKYYESHDIDVVVGGAPHGYYNMPVESIANMCILSILDNTPIQFSCDVHHYFHPDENLFDTKSLNYNLLFKTNFDKLSKSEMLNVRESNPNHAMVLVGVDLDPLGNPIKWKIENSWGRTHESSVGDYYIMSHDWFKRYVYDVVIHKKYVSRQFFLKYRKAKQNKVVLPEFDVMC